MPTPHQSLLTIERIIQLLILIVYEPKQWTANKLAEHFRTTIRTIYRDITRLENAGIHVYHEPTGGYYVTDSLTRLPFPSSQDDSLWLSLLPGLLHSMTNNSAVSVENLLHYVLRRAGGQGAQNEELSKFILWQSPLGTMTNHSLPQHVTELLNGMRNSVTISLTYATPNQLTTQAFDFDPYYLFFRPNGPYVIGFHHGRKAFRFLKVSRIIKISATMKTFVRNEPALQILDTNNSFGIDNSGEIMNAVLSFDQQVAVYVREELQATGLTWREETRVDQLLVHVRVRDNPEWIRWILQYGPEVEVIAPPTLRDRVKEKVVLMSQKYEHTHS